MEEKYTIVKAKMVREEGEGEYKEDKLSSNHNDNQLLRKYIHEIRNSKTYNIDILKNINNLSYEDRLKILIVYNEMTSYYLSIFEDI